MLMVPNAFKSGDPSQQGRGSTMHNLSWSIFSVFPDETNSHPVGVFGARGGIRTCIPHTVGLVAGGSNQDGPEELIPDPVLEDRRSQQPCEGRVDALDTPELRVND